ncbi:MAG: DMT family transporter [Candidatus Caldatribacteriota bacterium]|nr:DMT family transporter [Candidatus Caldatribacteriota bacterium]
MMKGIKAEFYLLGIVIVWGSTFAITKNILNSIPPYTFLAYRFLIAILVLIAIFWKKITEINKTVLKKGSLIGIFLFLGYVFQTVGIKYTTATKAGFITGLSVVLVPIISYFFIKEKINRNSIIGVILAFIGLWFLNYSSSFSFNFGDFLVLLCAFSLAMHIISVGLYSRKSDYVLLVIVQLTTVFVLSLLLAVIFERPALLHLAYSFNVWWGIIFMAVFATSFAFYMQNRFQRYSTPTKTAIIFSGEPIFAAIFSYFLLGEKISFIAWVGGLLIILGMVVSQRKG